MKLKIILISFLAISPFLVFSQWITLHSYFEKPQLPTLYQISFATPQKGIGIGRAHSLYEGWIARTFDGGQTWDTCFTSANPSGYALISNLDSNTFLVGMESNKLFKTSNFGQSWDTINLTMNPRLMNFPSENAGYIYSNNGIYFSNNGGHTWSLVYQGSINLAIDMDFSNDSTGIIATSDEVYRTNDYGQTWTLVYQSVFPQYPIFSIDFLPSNIAYLIHFDLMSFDSIPLMQSIDGGLNWSLKSKTPQMTDIGDMEFTSDSVGYIIQPYLLFKTIDSGATWTIQHANLEFAEFIYDLEFLNDSIGFCSGINSQFHKTTNGGELIDSLISIHYSPQIIEGGSLGFIQIKTNPNHSDTIIVPINYLPSQATLNIDLSPIPDTVFILPNSSNAWFQFNAYSDQIAEGIEELNLLINNSFNDTISINIIDSAAFSINISASDTISCGGNPIKLKAIIQPYYNFDYYWKPYSNLIMPYPYNSTIAYPDSSEWYYVSTSTISAVNLTDSIYIHYNSTHPQPFYEAICENDSILFGLNYLKTAGTYFDTLTSVYGCDSIQILYLFVRSLPTVNISSFPIDTVCIQVNSIALPPASPINGSYSGTGVDTSFFFPSVAGLGTHWVKYSYTNNYGCSNVDSSSVYVVDCTSIKSTESNLKDLIKYNYQDKIGLIKCINNDDKIENVKIYSINNQTILSNEPYTNTFEFNTTNWSKGLYLIEIKLVNKGTYLIKTIL